MSTKKDTFPRRGFALFDRAGQVEVRTVNVTFACDVLHWAAVTEVFSGISHVLELDRVASERTLAAKKEAFAKTLSTPADERPNHTVPVMTPAGVDS